MNNSSCHSVLRILTGKHAGAELPLSKGQYSIGAHEGCDIVISDCKVKSTMLAVENDIKVSIESDSDVPSVDQIILPNQPVKLGDVVITFFNPKNSNARPTDLELLQALLATPKPTESRKFGASRWVAGVSACSVMIICVIALQSPRSTAATRATFKGESELVQVKKILADPRFANVHASGTDKNIIVAGLVHNREEKESLAARLQSLQSNAIRHQYASETEVITAINDVIAVPGTRVSHAGGGRFTVTGEVPDSVQKKPEIKRLKVDLSGVISEITFIHKNADVGNDAIEQGPNVAGYQFRLAPDGTKYFISK